MRHVDGKVDYLEVWNEPNEHKWWPTGPDPVEFARLLSVTYTAVHTVSPSTQVVSGGLAGNDIGYLDKVYDAFDELGLKASPFDMVGAHPFSGDRGPRRRSTRPSATSATRTASTTRTSPASWGCTDVMAEHGDDDAARLHHPVRLQRPARPRTATPSPTTLRAQYLTQALEQATCVPYVPIFSWYALHPTPWDPQEYTLLDHQNRPNQTYAALGGVGRAGRGGAVPVGS